MRSRRQVAAGFLGLLGFALVDLALLDLARVDLALEALRGVAGAIAIGRPAGAAEASLGSGPALKNARHSGESCDLLRTMHAVTRSTSGISGPQSRIASGVQACCCSGV